MAYEVEKVKQEIERTYDSKRVRTSKEQLGRILAPIFVAFPGLNMSGETFGIYHKMLADLDPIKLEMAVMAACKAHKYPTQLITVAAIRECYEDGSTTPGPRNDVDPALLPDIPRKLFRLPDEEDRQERLERLRQTKKWDRYYA